MVMKKIAWGRSDRAPIISALPREYGDRMLMQYPMIDKTNLHYPPAQKIYKNYYVPIYIALYRSILTLFFHIQITATVDNPIGEDLFFLNLIENKEDFGDDFFQFIANAVRESNVPIKISNPFEIFFFFMHNKELFIRMTSPIVLSPYAAKVSKNPVFFAEGYNDSVSLLMLYIMSINVERELTISNLAEWAEKIERIYHSRAISGEHTRFATEKYIHNTYKSSLFDLETDLIEYIKESLDIGEMDYDPRAIVLRNLISMPHRLEIAYEAAVKSLALYYMPSKREFIIAPDVDLCYNIYEEDDNDLYYLPVAMYEYGKVIEIFENSLADTKPFAGAIDKYEKLMRTIVSCIDSQGN